MNNEAGYYFDVALNIPKHVPPTPLGKLKFELPIVIKNKYLHFIF
jgi:hypothetical protein